MPFPLTYVVNTYNKLPYLKESLPRLLACAQADEEIVVIDGASTDATVDYLRSLYEERRIHQFVSEPDAGEAHGWNRGILLARGRLIKLISDDDAFWYEGVRRCRDFMLENEQVDVVATEGADSPWVGDNQTSAYYRDFARYVTTGRPFGFCGLGLMLRRKSLAMTGLFDPAWKRMDHEFSLRLTSGPARLTWYTGYCWARISNPSGGTTQNAPCIRDELRRLDQHYFGRRTAWPLSSARRGLLSAVRRALARQRQARNQPARFSLPRDVSHAFAWCEEWLDEFNQRRKGRFLVRHTPGWKPKPPYIGCPTAGTTYQVTKDGRADTA